MEENRLVIDGTVGRRPESRKTPAGITITRFPLRHRSVRQQAGMAREVRCQLWVKASGEAVPTLPVAGDRVRISGFLALAGRHDPRQLVLHAEEIEIIERIDDSAKAPVMKSGE